MNWLLANLPALIPVLIKYGPLIFAFIQTEGPGVEAFTLEVHAAIQGAKKPDGTMDWMKLVPIAAKYGPPALAFAQTQGVQAEHLILDILSALKGHPPTAPVPAHPNFVFPAQTAPAAAAPTGSFTS